MPGPVKEILVYQGDRDDLVTLTWSPPEDPADLSKYVLTIKTIQGTVLWNFEVQGSSSLEQEVDALRKLSTIAIRDKKQYIVLLNVKYDIWPPPNFLHRT